MSMFVVFCRTVQKCSKVNKTITASPFQRMKMSLLCPKVSFNGLYTVISESYNFSGLHSLQLIPRFMQLSTPINTSN